ncbi:hypothetical protein Bca52824_095722 [Brassica carinata]|uniref:Pentatricopeptide repeat-containing protein n=1 Tax=Brassica carinata TaxID=52824 RepID=A0A8X7P2V8_BRACI|nr:hypothetical protein Bca52824_095722 [Brassica carinata]
MAGLSSLIPKTSLKRAVTRAAVNLSAPLSTIPAARNLFPGGGGRNVGERASNLHKAIRNAGTLTRPFHRLLGVKSSALQMMMCKMLWIHQRRKTLKPLGSIKLENNIPKKDKIKFLVKTLLDIEDNKEAVYGALDAWVAWERNFPIASLKRVIAILEKEHQWHRMVQVIKWILSKGQGTTMGTYGQLIRALDMDRRAEEAHAIWRKKIGHDLHSVPWQLCLQMTRIYFRNNMLQELVKLFRDLERYDRKPPDKHIVQIVADAYELLGMVEEKERVLEKYSSLFLGAGSDDKSRRSSRKKKKPVMNYEAKAEDAVDASKAELDQESEGCH